MIETKRLIIKPLTSDELIKQVDSPDKLAEDLGLTPSQALITEETKGAIINDLLANITDLNKNSLFYTMWIVIEKSKKAIIGGICFHGEPDENGEVEIGYGTDDSYRNKGYMTEAIAGLINWIRSNKKVRVIKAETDTSNIPSIRVLKKNGFKVFRRHEKMILKLELNKKTAAIKD